MGIVRLAKVRDKGNDEEFYFHDARRFDSDIDSYRFKELNIIVILVKPRQRLILIGTRLTGSREHSRGSSVVQNEGHAPPMYSQVWWQSESISDSSERCHITSIKCYRGWSIRRCEQTYSWSNGIKNDFGLCATTSNRLQPKWPRLWSKLIKPSLTRSKTVFTTVAKTKTKRPPVQLVFIYE